MVRIVQLIPVHSGRKRIIALKLQKAVSHRSLGEMSSFVVVDFATTKEKEK